MYLAGDYIHPTPHQGRCRVRIYRPDLPVERSVRFPSAHSGDLLGNGEMVFVITAEDPANPLGELVSTEQPL